MRPGDSNLVSKKLASRDRFGEAIDTSCPANESGGGDSRLMCNAGDTKPHECNDLATRVVCGAWKCPVISSWVSGVVKRIDRRYELSGRRGDFERKLEKKL